MKNINMQPTDIYHILQMNQLYLNLNFIGSPLAPFRQQSHGTITAFLLSQLDHAPKIILAKKIMMMKTNN